MEGQRLLAKYHVECSASIMIYALSLEQENRDILDILMWCMNVKTLIYLAQVYRNISTLRTY